MPLQVHLAAETVRAQVAAEGPLVGVGPLVLFQGVQGLVHPAAVRALPRPRARVVRAPVRGQLRAVLEGEAAVDADHRARRLDGGLRGRVLADVLGLF